MRWFALFISGFAALSTGPATLTGAASSLPCEQTTTTTRLVAIGDVHGNLAGLETILEAAGLLNGRGEWTGGKTILIQTGDLIDRGSDDRGVLELLMDLETQARKAGGQVQVLLGNHEVMNLYGDLRYVSPESFARFADKKSENRLEKAFKKYLRFLKTKSKFLEEDPPEFSEKLRQKWFASHPAGYLEHREAFSPSGTFGKWLRKKEAIQQEGGYIFLHGGIEPALPADLDKINSIIRQEIENYDRIREYLAQEDLIPWFSDYAEVLKLADDYTRHLQSKEILSPQEEQLLPVFEALTASTSWLSVHPDGPLWYRGFAKWPEDEGEELARELASKFQVCGFVVGHTPQLESGIKGRFGGLIFLIDTGMLSSYYEGGTPSALEIDSSGISALYPGNRVELTIEPPAAQDDSGR